jgi:hypothetical protein
LHIKYSSARAAVHATAATLLTLAAAGCNDTLRALGTSPGVAENRANQLVEAMTARFSPTELSPRYDVARVKLAQAALTPSKVFNDTAVWDTKPTPTTRLVYITGHLLDGGKYRLETRPSLTPATRLGDTRHVVSLEKLPQLGDDVYRWDTRVDLAVGSVTAEDVGKLGTALFAAAEGRGERELRDDYRAAFPRATAAFGRGFTIDSVRATPGALGTTSVAVTASFRPNLMKPAFPALAKYLDKYLGPAKYHLSLADRAGVPLFDAVGHDRTLTVRYRVQQGKLTSLSGTPKPWADSLVLTSDVSLKVKIFTVGFKALVTDFVISNSGHDRSWAVVAQREPKWSLPLFTESLIRSPLRRPFEGQGATIKLSVRDSAGAQTLVTRRTRLDVQESTIMRFLGGLVSHAIGELDAAVEAEQDRFFRDGFVAIQADLKALVPRWR